MIVAEQALNEVKTEVVVPTPKQTKLLGAVVAGIGTITTVSVQRRWCWALIEDAQGKEHHVFVADLKRDMLTFPVEPMPYVQVTRRVGYGLWDEVYQLAGVEFSDLTHVDLTEQAAA